MQNRFQNPADFFTCYQKTAWEKDIAGMISLYDDEVEIFDMWEKGYTSGLVEWTAIITAWLTSLNEEKVNVQFERINIQEGDHLAFANALIQFQAIGADGSVLRSMKNRISVGMVKRNGFLESQTPAYLCTN